MLPWTERLQHRDKGFLFDGELHHSVIVPPRMCIEGIGLTRCDPVTFVMKGRREGRWKGGRKDSF